MIVASELDGFARRLREERELKGLKQPEFAALGGVGRTSQTQYEAGKGAPDADYLYRLAQHGVDIGYILLGRRQGATERPETRQFLDKFMRLSERERHAVDALVTILSGGSGDQLARLIAGEGNLDIASLMVGAPTLHERQIDYRKKKKDD